MPSLRRLAVQVVVLLLALGRVTSGEAAPVRPFSQTVSPAPTKDGRAYVGEIRAFAGPKCPDGWVPCDGSKMVINPTTQDLFLVIGDYWGRTAAEEFMLPDLRGVFLRGWNNGNTGRFSDPNAADRELATTLAPDPGAGKRDQVGTYQADAFLKHSHLYHWERANRTDGHGGPNAGQNWYNSDANPGRAGSLDQQTVPTGDEETRPRNASVLFCIRIAP